MPDRERSRMSRTELPGAKSIIGTSITMSPTSTPIFISSGSRKNERVSTTTASVFSVNVKKKSKC